MFEMKRVSLSFGNLKVLSDFSLVSQGNEFICLLGASGIGKTSILNILAGLLKPQEGYVETKHYRIGYVFQEPRLIPWCNVKENLEAGLWGLEISKTEKSNRIDFLIEKLELTGFVDFYPGQLSGGMKQRVSLGRAFAIHPDLLLMDEPFSSLDENLKQDMRVLLKSLIEWQPCTTVFVTHDIMEGLQLADRIIVLKGRPCQIVQSIELEIDQASNEEYLKLLAQEVAKIYR
ncbi:MAG: ABC transporter ATP-binding protein [Syntrophomonadaceae bacterium]|jgi:ABC-type nitrate/sulfonate/bicarbonate transport system ATPase subunit